MVMTVVIELPATDLMSAAAPRLSQVPDRRPARKVPRKVEARPEVMYHTVVDETPLVVTPLTPLSLIDNLHSAGSDDALPRTAETGCEPTLPQPRRRRPRRWPAPKRVFELLQD